MTGQLKWLFAYIDLALALVALLFTVQFFLILSVNPKADANPEAMKPPGSIAVLACWPEGPTDIDLWADAPGQNVPTGYSAKSGLVWSLLRDDLGNSLDSSPANCESLFARSTPAGEFVINLHGYSLPKGPVTVRVDVSLNAMLLISADVDIRPKQERTVIRFTLDGAGKIIPGSVNQVFKKLRSANK